MIHPVTRSPTPSVKVLLQILCVFLLLAHETSSQSTVCFQNSVTACANTPDGLYPACPPLCSLGFFYSCSRGIATTKMCPAWSRTHRGVAPMVFDVITQTCQQKSFSCQKMEGLDDTDSRNAKRCIGGSPAACKLLKDGDYPACGKRCGHGAYFTCKKNVLYHRFCPFGWYTDFKNSTFLVPLTFDLRTKRCQFSTKSCPRDLTELDPIMSQTRNDTCLPNDVDACKGQKDGKYAMCYPVCALGAFFYCLDEQAYYRYCPTDYYPAEDNITVVARQVFSSTSGHCVKMNIMCPHNLDVATGGKEACMTQSEGACKGLPAMDFPACKPLCDKGQYFTCDTDKQLLRSCPQGWYRKDGKNYLAPMTYSSVKKVCDYSSPSCPRDEDNYLI